MLAGGGASLCCPRRRSGPEWSARLSREGVVRLAAGTRSAWVGRVAGWVLPGEPKARAQRPAAAAERSAGPGSLPLASQPSRALGVVEFGTEGEAPVEART